MNHFGVILFILAHVFLVDGGHKLVIRVDSITGCDYDGYVPGGKIRSVGKIEAPVAKLEKNAMNHIFGRASQGAGALSKAPWEKGAKILKGIMAFAKIAPYMGPMFAAVSSVSNTLFAMTKPTLQDVIDATNKAIKQLTNDINKKLEKMEDYVNAKALETLKIVNTDAYKVLYDTWVNCAFDAIDESDSTECQVAVYRSALGQRRRFMRDVELIVKNNTKSLGSSEMRVIEGHLLLFRDYANLNMKMIKPLIDNFKNKAEQSEDKKKQEKNKRRLKFYLEQMRTRPAEFLAYAKGALGFIEASHSGIDDAGLCPGDLQCSYKKENWEGWTGFESHTSNSYNCNCTIDEGTREKCVVKLTERVDGKTPSGYETPYMSQCTGWIKIRARCAVWAFGKGKVMDKAKAYESRYGYFDSLLAERTCGFLPRLGRRDSDGD